MNTVESEDPAHKARVWASLTAARCHLLHRTDLIPNPPAYALAADRTAAELIQSLIDTLGREIVEQARQEGGGT